MSLKLLIKQRKLKQAYFRKGAKKLIIRENYRQVLSIKKVEPSNKSIILQNKRAITRNEIIARGKKNGKRYLKRLLKVLCIIEKVNYVMILCYLKHH